MNDRNRIRAYDPGLISCALILPTTRVDPARASQELLALYKAIGIFEHWDLSMQLFDATVVSSVREWRSSGALNPGPASAERDEVGERDTKLQQPVDQIEIKEKTLVHLAFHDRKKNMKETSWIPHSLYHFT